MICDLFDESLSFQENLMAKYYVKLGHELTIIASNYESAFAYVKDVPPPRTGRTYRADGATVVKLPYRFNIANRLRWLPRLDDLLARVQPDLIFVHGIVPNLADAVRYKRRHPGSRLVLDFHGDYANSGKNWLSLKILNGTLRKAILSRAMPYLDAIYPITPATARFLHEVLSVPHERMELLPLGADLDLAAEIRRLHPGPSLRQRYGIPPAAPVVFTGGKLAPHKRTELLIEAMGLLCHCEARLVVAGRGGASDAGYEEGLREIGRRTGRVVFAGWLDTRQMLEHLDMADLAAFPASQSIVWQQAIGMGKPLVIGEPMARAGGAQDFTYLNVYDNVLITEEEEPTACWLATSIDGLCSDPERLQRMAAGALRAAQELLDWNSIVCSTLHTRGRAL